MDKLAAIARARIAILELMKFLLSYFGVTIAMFLCMTRCVLVAEKKGHHFTSDARPVFPEERLLLEVLLNKPLAFLNDSVWNGTGNRYYVNGKRISFSVANLKNYDPDQVRLELARYMPQNNYDAFNCMIARWVEANSVRFGHITDEAHDFIRKITEHFWMMRRVRCSCLSLVARILLL